jgi:Holliday junction resolvasome RuvABC endonuclease subunit
LIWGIDLGVRSAFLACLDGDELVYVEKIEIPSKVVRSIELDHLVAQAREFIAPEDDVFLEAPPMAGPRNIGTFGELHQTLGALLSCVGGRTVNVMSWKKDVVGKGNATKDEVTEWLRVHHPGYHAQCRGNQNLVDATCIALYGSLVMDRAEVLAEQE